ncbi:hypothetical protein CDAR_279131 [Caerostris darwini]|uniref:Uncharacterized protein n=1 Tax=Caerostris darwini TaxID=1538125 RepID=A0AAV4T4H5_9ARAC|nr:hypothetical protein CDAR_279131 [Caerostris darwini]
MFMNWQLSDEKSAALSSLVDKGHKKQFEEKHNNPHTSRTSFVKLKPGRAESPYSSQTIEKAHNDKATQVTHADASTCVHFDSEDSTDESDFVFLGY